MKERWCSIDRKLDLRPRIIHKSIEKVLEEVSRRPRSSSEGQFILGIFVVPSPNGDLEAGCDEALIENFELNSVKV